LNRRIGGPPELVWLLGGREKPLLLKLMVLILKDLTAMIIPFNF